MNEAISTTTEVEKPEVITADLAMQAISALYAMVERGEPHTPHSNALVVAVMCHLRDIKAQRAIPIEAPHVGSIALDETVQSMTRTIEEMRAAVSAAGELEKIAASRATVAEEYAEYYLVLRDHNDAPFCVLKQSDDFEHPAIETSGEDLDNAIEDYLTEKARKQDPDQEMLDSQTPL